MSLDRAGWYARRLAAMSPGEMAWHARDRAIQTAWRRRQIRPADAFPSAPAGPRPAPVMLPPAGADAGPPEARAALVSAADRLLAGSWETLGAHRTDLADPDWFFDPVTGRRAPQEQYAFAVAHRREDVVGNIKQVWEPSRHQHLTLLAGAWRVTGDDVYADTVDRQLRSWWRANPFLSGVHWTSGIELGLRLISWVWVRRLLDGWPGAAALFEENDAAATQIRWHLTYLAALRSRGSSGNNHAVAEAAGQLTAACAFPWFAETGRWRVRAARALEASVLANTFDSGLNREQASEYHGFVAELTLVAAVEAAACDRPLSPATWDALGAMLDAEAATLDVAGRIPRQGDGDDGRGYLLDAPDQNRSRALLATGAAVVGACDWWPSHPATMSSALLGALTSARPVRSRPARRPSHFADAGLTLLRTAPGVDPELWCRVDGGPHGYLSIAGHAHADALSVELRHDGVDVLADPGCYCYHGEPAFRSYFRSTLGHNTVELDGRDQSEAGGPFLWRRQARTRILRVDAGPDGDVSEWSAAHDGYEALDPPATHRRSVTLDAAAGRVTIVDRVDTEGRYGLRAAWHLGPDVDLDLQGATARLTWTSPRGDNAACLQLSSRLIWTAHRGETEPPLGWYSPSFGVKVPAWTLLGQGSAEPGSLEFRTVAAFDPGPAEPVHHGAPTMRETT